MLLAQEILVDYSSYPTARICENSHNFRPLGLGYANLGGLLMRMGIPYDSEQAATVTFQGERQWHDLRSKILKDFGQRMSSDFTVPEGLKERTEFWFDIYVPNFK
jgi:hypothetical protein